MSRYTYAGPFKNPTEGWFVKEVDDHFEIWIRDDPDRPHTSKKQFAEWDDAAEYIESMQEFFEQDYDDYLEENHDAICAQERLEDFRNEY